MLNYHQADILLAENSQSHILRFWKELTPSEQKLLLCDIEKINFNSLKGLQKLIDEPVQDYNSADIRPDNIIDPEKLTDSEKNRLYQKGEDALKNGKTAFFVVAGGQGSRLGYERAKGTYEISPIRRKSLFYIHCRKVLAASRYYGVKMPLVVMTSEVNHQETIDYFKSNDYFNLQAENVFFTMQGVLPALDFSGRLMLAEKHRIFFSPDGHGGALQALNRNNIPEIFQKRGIEVLSYFQVDNPLVHIADPLYIGLHLEKKSEMSCKVLKKRNSSEKIGVAAVVNGKKSIVEYSDLPRSLAEALGSDGELLYGYGSIAIHMINLAFIEKFKSGDFILPCHIARKAVPFIDETGKLTQPPGKMILHR